MDSEKEEKSRLISRDCITQDMPNDVLSQTQRTTEIMMLFLRTFHASYLLSWKVRRLPGC